MRSPWSLSLLLMVTLTACSQRAELVPGQGALPAPDFSDGAVAEAAGVRVSATGDGWRGEPSNLETHYTPVLVRIENNSPHQLVIRYQKFEFQNAQRNYDAIPPYDVDISTVDAIDVPAYTLRSFAVAPYLTRFYSRVPPWSSPFRYDPAWYTGRYTAWRELQLPTADMVRMALPEGVLDPGGVAEGFVYFERIADDDRQVALNLDLTMPIGDNFGRVQVPFRVE